MKTFSDNLKPIEVELIDNKGNSTKKIARFLSVGDCEEISKKFKEAGEDGTGEKSYKILREQMCYIFGGKAEEYRKYSPKLIKDVLGYVTEEIINPTKEIQEEKK